jgi:phosphate transport system substrate-binding protein
MGIRRTIMRIALLSLAPAYAVAQTQTISETGSTLIYPLFQKWVAAYAQVDANLVVTVAATGSGAGIAAAMANQTQIGTSDAYMSDDQAMSRPHVLNIPLAISALTVEANLPELKGTALKLTGPILAGIYTGTIRTWDAPPIAAINPGLHLPHQAIVPVRRADGSGDTFVFTQFLAFSTQSWQDKIAYGTAVSWPSVAGALTGNGNSGVLQTLARTPYAVGYLGASFLDEANQAGLITAMVQNQQGNFLLPTAATVTAAAAVLTPRTPADERLTLVFAPGPNSYPLINYEYALVWDKQATPQIASALSSFLLWCISPEGGSAPSFLDPVHFIALPTSIRARSEIQIAKIQ